MKRKIITFFLSSVLLLPTLVFANGVPSPGPGCLGVYDTIESLIGLVLMGVGVGVAVVLKHPK